MKKTKSKVVNKLIFIVILLVAAFIYYYIVLPPINIHSVGFWFFLLGAFIIALVIYGLTRGRVREVMDLKSNKVVRFGGLGIGALIIIFIIGSILSSPIVNAKKYQQLLTVEDREFAEDFQQASYNQIPLLDKESARVLGNRKMGTMLDMVSQFEVSDLYTQINYQGEPVRVTPLVYADPIKWLTNQSSGIPAYIKIDMASQETELVKLDESMRYSQSEYFNRNINRHLRFKYPTYIFDDLNFEIDDEGIPYWICPVKQYEIGLFGGETIGKVVICNAITGETKEYELEDCPSWIDRVNSAELLIQLYDYQGTLKHGYFNSILGQRDCLETTDGYNYLAMEDDVWVYTGVTSVSGDESNVGFVIMNQRTRETRFYGITGAEEYSAMTSAEGQVQHLGYTATFPLLLNIADEPTYFIALKDASGLVKMYAMVNVQKYQNVAIGDTVIDCEEEYISLLKKSGITEPVVSKVETKTGKIAKIVTAVVDGNTHYYIQLDKADEIYDVSIVDFINIINYEVGDSITLEYQVGSQSNTVLSISEE